MRVIVLGGAGDMGSSAVRTLAGISDVDEVVIGDINVERAREIAEEIGEKVSAEKVDIRKHEELVRILRGFDVVLNCVGPFYEWAEPVIRGAMDAGLNYVDICDDHDPTERMMQMDEEVKKAGILALIGCGWTPGLSNILARYGAEKLGVSDEIRISWVGGAADSTGFAVVKHVFHALTGKVPQYIDGELVRVDAGSGMERVLFPEPIGDVGVLYCGHPEPLTIPKYIEGVRTCTLKGALIPEWQNSLAKVFVKLGLTGGRRRKHWLAKAIHAIEDVFRAGGLPISGIRVDIRGERRGKEKRLILGAADRMYRLTGITAALTTAMVGRGQITGEGVYPPEAKIEPKKILKELEKYDIEIKELQE